MWLPILPQISCRRLHCHSVSEILPKECVFYCSLIKRPCYGHAKWLLIDFQEIKMQVPLSWNQKQNFSPVPNRDCPSDSPNSTERTLYTHMFIFGTFSLTGHFSYGRTIRYSCHYNRRDTQKYKSHKGEGKGKIQEKECALFKTTTFE